MKNFSQRLLIVSNRLPIHCSQNSVGQWKVEPSSGGLVSALDPVFKNRGGNWIGWPGTSEASLKDLRKPLTQVKEEYGYGFTPVPLSEKEKNDFYLGFSNEVLWPLFHDLQSFCNFDPTYFRTYQKVNIKFASVIAKNMQSHDLIWVHDYHLMNVADELKKMGVKTRLVFFLHIPFPPVDIFLKLPWRTQVLKSLLKFDLIGFQTARDLRNFLHCVRILEIKKLERRIPSKNTVFKIKQGNREILAGHFPISIDYEAFSNPAQTKEIQDRVQKLRKDFSHRSLIIGVDRLDYTKGIPYKLEAFRNALKRYPELRKKITLVQYVVPSREDIAEYHDLRSQIEQLAGEIYGQFTQSGWVPIHYLFHHSSREELLAHYRMAKIAMVTPLKDGMNLVAKEYCASNVDENGVLILSEFAGAAAQLGKWSLTVNPYNVEEMADSIYQAFKMPIQERKTRMKKLRRQIKNNDIFKWAKSFLAVAGQEPLETTRRPKIGIA